MINDIKSIIKNHAVENKDSESIYFLLNGDEVVYIARTLKVFPPLYHSDKEYTHISKPPIDSFASMEQ